MTEKIPNCCSRRQGKLHHDQNNLRTLARKAAYAQQKNRDITRLKMLMAEMKEAIVLDKEQIIEHEANHADGLV